jgi:uncharacterized membrane protein YkoI
MLDRPKKIALAVVASSAAALGMIGVADAAKHHKHHTKKHSAASTSGRASAETELTGATAQSAKDAALAAVPGGTVRRASLEDPADASGAKYEVHVTKSDGSEVEVLEDSSFKVLSTKASTHGPGDGHGRGGRGGPGGPNGETELTGSTAQSAKDAALAAVPGGTVERASLEDPSDASGAKYEVHVTKSDGSHVVVLEDSSFKVLSTTADNHNHHH